jgi:hypothetical protein
VTGVNGDGTTGEVIEGVDLVIEVSSFQHCACLG